MRLLSIESARAALLCAAMSAGIPACQAQEQRGARPAQISLNFSVMMPAGEPGVQANMTGSEATRRAFYEFITTECTVLLATIAASCQLTNASVNISEQRHNQASPYVQVSGSGNFAVQLKPRP